MTAPLHREPLNEYEWLKQYDEDYDEAFGVPVEDERDREIPDPVDDEL